MTKEEYLIKLYEEDKRHEGSIKAIMIDFIKQNNTKSVGDIVSDSSGSIKIEKMGFYLSKTEPCMFYRGVELKKDGTPRKDGSKRDVYQSSLI